MKGAPLNIQHVDGKQGEVFPLFDLPADMQRLVLGYVPLADLARLACLTKQLRTAYVDRVTKRDTAVTARLGSHFTPAFREGLTPAQTALPRDLVVDPPVWLSPSLPPYVPPSLEGRVADCTCTLSKVQMLPFLCQTAACLLASLPA